MYTTVCNKRCNDADITIAILEYMHTRVSVLKIELLGKRRVTVTHCWWWKKDNNRLFFENLFVLFLRAYEAESSVLIKLNVGIFKTICIWSPWSVFERK